MKVFEEDRRRARPIEKNMDKIPDKPDKKGILYIMIDGAAINTRTKTGQAGGKTSWGWCGDLRTRRDGLTHDILRKEYVPYIGSADRFKEHRARYATAMGGMSRR